VFGLSFFEVLVIAVVAILVFGDRLPTVAAEAANFVAKMRRSLADLRRETGIDREFAEARRAIEVESMRAKRVLDVPRSLEREVEKLTEPIATETKSALEAVERPPQTEGAATEDRTSTPLTAEETVARSPDSAGSG
jgi:Sec-independent protein translocase protein TatA